MKAPCHSSACSFSLHNHMRQNKQTNKKKQAPARFCMVSPFIHHAIHEMTTRGRLTCPQALQWCLRLVRALKGSLHIMHMVTSLSRIQRGARLPSSALWKSRNSAPSGPLPRPREGLQNVKFTRARAAYRHFLPFSQRVLEGLVFLLEDLDGLLESLEIKSKHRHHE